ncbi:MAG: energy-coupled thiamine transporter ThiT [Eubacterium sp.]
MIPEIFATQHENDWGEVVYIPTALGYATLVIVALLLVVLALVLFKKKITLKLTTKQLVVAAACMALAFVTSNLKVISMPMGGSVTLFSMMFITLIGYWYGLPAGIFSALAYGILQLIIDPYVLSLPQMIIDYPLAFGALGLSGVFSKMKKVKTINIAGKTIFTFGGLHLGYLLAVFGRFVFAVLSGVIFFAYYAPEGWNAWWYSIAYNGAYIGAEAIITLIVLGLKPVNKAINVVGHMALED